MTAEARLREQICAVGRSLYQRGYVHGTTGNISVRLEGDAGYLVTPTDACLGTLDPAALAHVAPDGTHRGGAAPSKSLALHRSIYTADASARCVLHTHSAHLVALTLAGVWSADDVLPPITPYFVMKVGHVPLIAYRRPGDPAVGPAVAERIRAAAARGVPLRAVLMERLGPNVWHRSLDAASAVLEELEETARLWLMREPRPDPLAAEQIEELNRVFGACW
jgi:3-dehydro-4-phosphotetronate decarboxylase